MKLARLDQRTTGRLFLGLISALLLGLTALGSTPPLAQAATIWKVSPNSLGACTAADPNCASLSAAIQAATRGDTIVIAPGTYIENVTVNKNLTIIGAGVGQTVLDGGYGKGCVGTAPLYKSVIVVLSGYTVNISDLTLQHGCIIENGDPIVEGGGLNNHGTTSLTRVIVQENTVRGPLGGGGGISNETQTGVLFLTDVLIANNTAEEGGGLDNDHYATLTNVSVFGNKAVGERRGEGAGGGIENGTLAGAAITMTNVTVYANSARTFGGGISSDADAVITATNITVDRNVAPHAGGIENRGIVNIKNSIIANSAGGNCLAALVASGLNLSTDASCGKGFVVKADVGLSGILAANGGFAPTEALLPGSPAIGAMTDCPVYNAVYFCDLGAFVFNRPSSKPAAAPPVAR